MHGWIPARRAATGDPARPFCPFGLIDSIILWTRRIRLLEFQGGRTERAGPGRVLEQIQARGYHQKYADQPVTLIGMEFSRAERNLTGFEWRRLDP